MWIPLASITSEFLISSSLLCASPYALTNMRAYTSAETPRKAPTGSFTSNRWVNSAGSGSGSSQASPTSQALGSESMRSSCPQRHSVTVVSRPFLPQISPIFRHFSPVLSVLAPGSQTAQNNGGKTAENGRETAEKQWAKWRWDTESEASAASPFCQRTKPP